MTEQMWGAGVVTGAPGSSMAMKLEEQPRLWKQMTEDERCQQPAMNRRSHHLYSVSPCLNNGCFGNQRLRNIFWYNWYYHFQEENAADKDFSLRSRYGTLMSGVVGKCLQFPRNQHGSVLPTSASLQVFMLFFFCFPVKKHPQAFTYRF